MKLGVVILAAGQGTRMRSSLPKVLHPLAGKPLLAHVISTAKALKAETITVVYGHGGEAVKQAIRDPEIEWVEQSEQLGTGHAVDQAMASVAMVDKVLVLYGDVPLISQATLQRLIDCSAKTNLGVLTAILDDPSGYGRIVRDDSQNIRRIVEQKDASSDELALHEVNTGILLADREQLGIWLSKLEDNNAQSEFYLTDIIAMAVEQGVNVAAAHPDSEEETLGVNDRVQLAYLERHFQKLQAEAIMRQGVTLADPNRFDLRGELQVGQDTSIDVNVILEGHVELGERVTIGPNTLIRNCRIGDGVEIFANCVLDDAVVGNGCRIGPYARLRPLAELADDVHVGNFVEIKKSTVDKGSKINHLSYIGDASIGSKVNIGAGTITCNYDGVNKSRTVIGDRAFIGSDTQLIAPVEVGADATIGAGSTITKDTPVNTLTLSRSKQISFKEWKRPVKKPT